MKKAFTGLILGICCWAVAAASLAEHYALCTGLNKYKTSYVPSSSFLNGCVPDAKNVYTNITLRGEWTTANATIFTNSQGTFAAVSNKLMSFASAAVSGDVVLYYHSSHGYQDSGKNTGICMFDDDMPDSSFAKILANFKAGVKVIIVLDTCHSGGMFKSLRRDGTARALDTGSPFAFAERVNEELASIRADEAARGIKAAKLAILDCAWVTAADYNQYSWDGDEGGAFTDCYIGSVKSGACDKSPYGNGDSYATFMEMFNYAVEQEETHGDGKPGSEDYTMPQCTNTTILSAVTFGWIGAEEPTGIRFSPIPEQAATAGQEMSYTLVATNVDGSTGAIDISISSSTAPADSYSFSGKTLTFTPPTDGAFSFSFLATNATAGTDGKATMTVKATLAAPADLENSGISASSFTANWGAVAGAASYLVDVATDASFDRGGGGVLVEEGFDAGTKLAEGWTVESGDLGGVYDSNGNYGDSSPALKLSYTVTLSTPVLNHPLDISFWYKGNGGAFTSTLEVEQLVGGSWTAVSEAEISGKAATYSHALDPAATQVRFVFTKNSGNVALDDVKITGIADDSTLVVDGASVSGTSYTAEALDTATYYWRVRAVGNAQGPYSATEEVTLNADPTAPPSIRTIDDIDIKVGETATAIVKVSSPEEAPATVSITAGDAAAKLGEDGVFTFAPEAVGVYPFTITAANANGDTNASFTVTATLAEPEAPTASVVDSDSFTATWTAIPGAESYELLVIEGKGSSGGGGGGGSGGTKIETFANATFSTAGGGYVNQTISGGDLGTWTATQCRGDQGGVPTVGGTGTLTSPEIADGVSAVEFDYGWPFAETVSGDIDLYVGGSKVSSASVTGGTPGTATYSFSPVSGATSIEFVNAYATAKKLRISFNEIRITTASGKSIAKVVGDVIYSNNVGNVTSFEVTDLQPNTEYTFAFRAIAGEEATEWSEPVSVTTADGPAAPSWTEIPELSAAVGYPFSIDLAPYASGVPTPTLALTAGTAELTGTVLSFTPDAVGDYTFTVTASNSSGDPADAIVTVTAIDHVPTKYAVCVGINEYAEISGLSGCVNDSIYIENSLIERGGWAAENVVRLNDKNATKAAIRGAIAAVAAKAQAGDTFVYQHSSHGGQFNDTTGDIITNETGKATFLCVYDEDYDDNKTAYNDYEIAADFAAFNAGVKVVAIVDACHSGGLFKSKEEARAAAASFDLAGRVTAIMDANRAQRKTRGEDVARTLDSSEIGWATACEYYETSYDGGFFHTDEWLTNNAYGDEYWNANTEEYNYPASYKQGGVFTASAAWGWWNGTADADPEAGNNDGFCDVYEFWKAGYDFCSKVGEFWWEEPEYNYYPQCTNIAVLKSVELGWIVDPRIPAPEEPAAPEGEVTASSFTAEWKAVDDAVSYNLYVQMKVEDGAKAAAEALFSENFAGFTSAGSTDIADKLDTYTAVAGWSGFKVYSDDGRAKLGTGSFQGWIATPAIAIPSGGVLSFTATQFNDKEAGTLSVNVSTDGGATWEAAAEPFTLSLAGDTFEVAFDKDYEVASIQFIASCKRFYLDDVVLSGKAGKWVDVEGYSPMNVKGTSQVVDGLEMGTDYRFSVTAVDAEGVESVPSERVTVTTAEEDSAPVWKEIPEQAALKGQEFTFDAADYVKAVPAATITLVETTAAEADYLFDNGYLVFTPSAEGTFTFSLNAKNDLGDAPATLAVAVGPAPTTVPTLALSNPQATSFDASWTACTGVSSYTLQVATDDQFTTGSAAGTVELFNNPAGSATAPEGWTYDISSKTGKYVVLDDTAQSVVSPAVSTKGMNSLTIAFKSRTYGGTGAGLARVEYSADGGSTWAEVGTAEADSSTMASRTLDAAKCIGLDSVKFRWTAPNATGSKGIGIQNLVLSGEGSGGDGSLIKELTVEGTSTTVTGLEPETLYYARVKGAAEWSAVESIATVSDVPTRPAWLEIPAQTATVGQVFELDLSSYVTGSPFPTITVDGAVAEGGNWSFTPDEAKTYAFELVATNTQGSDSTTLTVVAEEAPPAKYALCVGLNEYDYAAWEAQGWNIGPLKGCVNDATFLKKNLTERGGWADADVTLLTNETATEEAIRAAIADYAKRAKAGDTFIYQHSSHGLNNEDLENDEYTKDVALATYAAPYEDFELAEDLAAFADGVKVVIAIDACHSAGMFKKGVAATAGSFDIAALVSALMDANRVARKARGEDVSRNLSSDQVGWITAADYDEESKDGGYYDTDEWLSDDDDEGEVRGGTFLASLTWGWWSGKADVSGTGDGDGWFDAYEGWGFASPVCIDAGFTPQFLNESVLRSVELGYAGEAAPSEAILFDPVPGATVAIGEEATLTVVAKNADGTTDGITLAIVATDPEGLEYTFEDGTLAFTPEEDGLFLFTVRALNGRTSATKLLGVTAVLPAPVALDATDTDDDSFTANWTGVDAAQGYQLQVSSSDTFPMVEADEIIEEGFDGVTDAETLPKDWTFKGGTFSTYTGKGYYGEASPSIKISTKGTNILSSPTFKVDRSMNGLSFWTMCNSTNPTSTVTVELLVGGAWKQLDSFVPSPDGQTKEYENFDPSATQVRFVVDKANGNVAIDDVKVIQAKGDMVVDDGEIPAGTTSYAVEDLEPGTTYYYRVRALGASTKSAWSETIEVTTTGETPLPVPDLTVGNPVQDPDTAIYAVWLCDGVAKVQLQVASDAEFGAESLVFDEEVSDDVCLVSGLTPETTYYVRARALVGERVGEWSEVQSVTTAGGVEPEEPEIGGKDMEDFELSSDPDPVSGKRSIKTKATGKLAETFSSVQLEYATELKGGDWNFDENEPIPNTAEEGWPAIEFEYPDVDFAIMRFVFE